MIWWPIAGPDGNSQQLELTPIPSPTVTFSQKALASAIGSFRQYRRGPASVKIFHADHP
jgi:hypothetical protein